MLYLPYPPRVPYRSYHLSPHLLHLHAARALHAPARALRMHISVTHNRYKLCNARRSPQRRTLPIETRDRYEPP